MKAAQDVEGGLREPLLAADRGSCALCSNGCARRSCSSYFVERCLVGVVATATLMLAAGAGSHDARTMRLVGGIGMVAGSISLAFVESVMAPPRTDDVGTPRSWLAAAAQSVCDTTEVCVMAALAFTLGSQVPLQVTLLLRFTGADSQPSVNEQLVACAAASHLGLLLLGALRARLAGTSASLGALRMMAAGWVAMLAASGAGMLLFRAAH